LLSDNSESLSYCLDQLKNHDLFVVSQSELQKVHPSIIISLLKKFGIKTVKGVHSAYGQIDVPMDFNDWVNQVLMKDVRDEGTKNAILHNDNLMAYLKGVIAIARANPAILNKNVRTPNVSQSVADTNNTYLEQLEINYYVRPVDEAGARLYGMDQFKNYYVRNPQQPSLSLGSNLHNPFNNAQIAYGPLSPVPWMMAGGGAYDDVVKLNTRGKASCSSAELMKEMMVGLFADLRKHNIYLQESDKQKISEALNLQQRREAMLSETASALAIFVDLLDVVNPDGRPAKANPSTVDLGTIINTSKSDVVRSLVNNSTELEYCMRENIKSQCLGVAELMKVYAAISDSIQGIPNPNIIEVSNSNASANVVYHV